MDHNDTKVTDSCSTSTVTNNNSPEGYSIVVEEGNVDKANTPVVELGTYVNDTNHTKRIKYSLILGLMMTITVTCFGTYCMQPCNIALACLFGLLWGFCLAWTWNCCSMLRSALVPGGSEAEFCGLVFATTNAVNWIPTLIFTIANEVGSIEAAMMSLNVYFVIGIFVMCKVDIDRGLIARNMSMSLRRWAHKNDATKLPSVAVEMVDRNS
jgi:hypothetical protein